MSALAWFLLVLLVGLIGFAYRQRRVGLVVWLSVVGALFLFTGKLTFLFVGVALCCVLLGQPLFVLMGSLTLVALVFVLDYRDASGLSLIIDKILELASKEVLLAIPFFVVAGELMSQGSLAQRLIQVARAVFGWMPGGLAIAAVAGCVFFAAISGSSPVTVIAIGSIMVPALLKEKYPEPFAIGLLTSAGSLGILIPPSIPMIVYAIMVGATTPMDPKDLFLGGVVPGLTIGLLLAGYSFYIGLKHKLPRDPFSWSNLLFNIKEGFWSLLLPVIILGGIYSGIFTTTEAAAVSVVYAFAVEIFIHGELKPKQLIHVAENSMTMMGALLLIIGLAIGLNHVLVDEQIPDRLVEMLKALDLSTVEFLLLANLFLLALGCVMDIMSAILIVAPMLAPMATAVGIDPIHMGIIFIVNLEIGYLTPPIGMNLFVASTLFRKGLGEIIKAVLPTLLLLATGLILITWVPVLSTGLVRFMSGKPIFDPALPAPTQLKSSPREVSPGEPGSRPKTLQELMRESQQKSGASQSERPKTLQELMEEAKTKSGSEASTNVGRPKTLQELMEEAKRQKAAQDETEASDEPKRVKTLQEMMTQAKARQSSEAIPDAEPSPETEGADGAPADGGSER